MYPAPLRTILGVGNLAASDAKKANYLTPIKLILKGAALLVAVAKEIALRRPGSAKPAMLPASRFLTDRD